MKNTHIAQQPNRAKDIFLFTLATPTRSFFYFVLLLITSTLLGFAYTSLITAIIYITIKLLAIIIKKT